MEISYKQIKETLKEKGTEISRLFVKYPAFSENEKLSAFYSAFAENYVAFVKGKCFENDKIAFGGYVEAGNRRSKYPTSFYFLSVTVSETTANTASLHTENYVKRGNETVFKKDFLTVRSLPKGKILRVKKEKFGKRTKAK